MKYGKQSDIFKMATLALQKQMQITLPLVLSLSITLVSRLGTRSIIRYVPITNINRSALS
jgi:hypothetical protein